MATEKKQMIHGVEVVFPCKPYPSQFSMMEKVIKGIERRQNCLLESPTGSGKSLALLCSALAWQKAEYAKKEQEESIISESKNAVCTCDKNSQTGNVSKEGDAFKTPQVMIDSTADLKANKLGDDDDDDFQDQGRQFRTPGVGRVVLKKVRKHVPLDYDSNSSMEAEDSKTEVHNSDLQEKSDPGFPEKCSCSCKEEKVSSRKVPKIYFGTRTHKQVAQITRELKKTAYKETRMTILAAREHMCIHPEVSVMKNKNEGCKELLDGPGCRFNDRVKKIIPSQHYLKSLGLNEAWDIEDLANLGKKHKVCPYFGSRSLKKDASIIFCPYNYLIDPVVRDAMEIYLKDQIIILDEAHNMEDSAREAASESIKEDQLQKAIAELDEMIRYEIKPAEHIRIRQVCSGLLKMIHENTDSLEQMDYDNEYKHWSGYDVVARLDQIGVGPKHFDDIKRSYGKICEDLGDKEKIVKDMSGKEIKLSSATLQCLEHIFKVLIYLYKNDLKFVPDYRMAVVKTKVIVRHEDTDDAWLNPRQRGRGRGLTNQLTFQHALNFWCMNPGVAFSDFDVCRCVVLTSGTLSPMSSFESELGVPFPIKLEASHVIEDKQVWVGAISHGPNGNSLQCVYKTMETWTFQDELGALVLKVCLTVPNGVLCFLSSYNALDKFRERWKRTGVWGKILLRKKIIVEPRASEKVDFEELMRQFYDTINNTAVKDEDDSTSERDGALFIAVCRGKVSEGLDFADNNARAVITVRDVGIPFPNFKDVQVKLKREYNDNFRSSRGLLSGSEWYEIQAFRALNQALGRCIRHRKDWGALILVDERFVKNSNRYCKGLSKWVRNKVQPFNDFHDAMRSIEKFTNNRMKDMPVSCPDTSFIPSTPHNVEGCKGPGVSEDRRRSFDDKPLTSTPQTKVNHPLGQNLPTHPFFAPFRGNDSFVSENSFNSAPIKKPVGVVDASRGRPAGVNDVSRGRPAYSLLSPTHVQDKPAMYQKTVAQSQVIRPTSSDNNLLCIPNVNSGGSVLQTSQGIPGTSPILAQGLGQKGDLKQVLDIINSPSVPKTKPYYLILNEGTPQQQAFLIEPPTVNEKTKVASGNEVNGSVQDTHNNVSIHPTIDAAQCVSSSPMDISSGSTNRTNSSNSASRKHLHENKFYRFHDAKNDRTVDHRESSSEEGKFCNNSMTVKKERTQSPVLFNNTEEDEGGKNGEITQELGLEMLEEMKKEYVPNTERVESRKPLFKRTSLSKMSASASKDQTFEDDSQGDLKVTKPDRRRSSVSRTSLKKFSFVSTSEKKAAENLFKSESSKIVDDNLLEENLVSVSDVSDLHLNALSPIHTPIENMESAENGHSASKAGQYSQGNVGVETLKTRRSSRGVKRQQQNSATKQRAKRSCGVDFLDGIEDGKENQAAEAKNLVCAECGRILVSNVREFEKRKKFPSFLKCVNSKRNAEVLYFCELTLKGSGLCCRAVTSGGLNLNSIWEPDLRCCIQYLECGYCASPETPSILGAKIVCTANSDEFTKGQTWLFSSGINIC